MFAARIVANSGDKCNVKRILYFLYVVTTTTADPVNGPAGAAQFPGPSRLSSPVEPQSSPG
jgi:hypothetical protein